MWKIKITSSLYTDSAVNMRLSQSDFDSFDKSITDVLHRQLGMYDEWLSFKKVSGTHVCDANFLNLVGFQS